MAPEIRLTIQVLGSLAIIFGVLWWMWRIPGSAVLDSTAGVLCSFVSVWIGLASVIGGLFLWITDRPEIWVPLHVALWAAAISTGGLGLWVYRHTPPEQMTEPIQWQRMQARIGLGEGLLAVILWYAFMIRNLAILGQ